MGNTEYLYITVVTSGNKHVFEKLPAFSYGLYYTYIRTIAANAIVNQEFINSNEFILWHDRLGHLGSIMMRKVLENSYGHLLKNLKILQSNEFSCPACSQGKFIIRPSSNKIRTEFPVVFRENSW